MESGIRRTRLIHWFLVVTSVVFSLYLAYQVRFEFHLSAEWEYHLWRSARWVLPLEFIVLYAFDLFIPLVARFRWRDFIRVLLAVSLTTIFLLYIWYVFGGAMTPPRSVIIINGLFQLVALCFLGSLSSQLRGILTGSLIALPTRATRVVVVGQGFLAMQLVRLSRERRGLGMRVVGVIALEASPGRGAHWLGIPLGGTVDDIERVCQRYDPDRLVITDPRMPVDQLEVLVNGCRRAHVPVHVVPSPQEMFYGILRPDAIRPVGLEDVLGRNSLEIDLPRIFGLLEGRVVMVTGGGGSIGSELCRQILACAPRRLLVLDASEAALFQIVEELRLMPFGDRVAPLLADVRDTVQVRALLESERPAILFHSAALKHVPMLQDFPAEALRTNTLATARLAEVADACGVERMVFISTDKAINPTNAMGASKRLAELLLQARVRRPGGLAVVAVRFGNVIGSSGSVIPIFERQIAAGGPVTVTHPDIRRYFMSIPEAVGLLLQSATQGQGGEIFMLDMGEPLKLVDVARKLILLRGLRPERDVEIKITGLRPGEKLFEELRYDGELHEHTTHPKVYQLTASPLEPEKAADLTARVEAASLLGNPEAVIAAIRLILPEFVEPGAERAREKDSRCQASGASHHVEP